MYVSGYGAGVRVWCAALVHDPRLWCTGLVCGSGLRLLWLWCAGLLHRYGARLGRVALVYGSGARLWWVMALGAAVVTGPVHAHSVRLVYAGLGDGARSARSLECAGNRKSMVIVSGHTLVS